MAQSRRTKAPRAKKTTQAAPSLLSYPWRVLNTLNPARMANSESPMVLWAGMLLGAFALASEFMK